MRNQEAVSLTAAFTAMLVLSVFAHAASHAFGVEALHDSIRVALWVSVALTGSFVHWAVNRLFRR